jgi:DNA-binding MarR family transcriptional regulator
LPSQLVLETLVITAHAIQRYADKRLGRYKRDVKMSGSRLRVLAVVGQAGSLRMGDVAARLGVAARTVTHMVDELEKEGLLARQPDPADRRATLLAVTPHMRARFDEASLVQQALTEEILAPLDEAERQHLLALLTRLKDGPIRGEAGHIPCADAESHRTSGGYAEGKPETP